MMPRRINFMLKYLYRRPKWNCRFCSTVPQTTNERDPAPLFFDQHVQKLLTTLTRIDYRKVFAAQKDGTPLDVPKFKFMTDEQLQTARSKIGAKARGRIQMPPIVKMRSNEVRLISKDSAIQGYDKHNYVFTDISFGSNNRERLIVVRDPNGALRHANSDERHRMNQVYFPVQGREIHRPQMFSNPHFDDLLKREEFKFILDRACVQFEPDDPEYHRVTREVYSYVNKCKKFDVLRSSRHFGPFTFYLAWENNINALLLDVIDSENIEEATALIQLYQKLHPDAKSITKQKCNSIELIKAYAERDSTERYAITRAIHRYETLRKETNKIAKGVVKAHGLIDETDEAPKK